MSTTVRPDNVRAALDAKLAAAMSQLVELREAEEPRVTLHLNSRAIVGAFLRYVCRVYPIADTFGRTQAGDLQFDAWHLQWTEALDDADRVLWKQLREERVRLDLDLGTELIDVEIPLPSADSRKRLVRFAASPNRAASEVCDDYLRLARRFAHDFLRDHARFLS